MVSDPVNVLLNLPSVHFLMIYLFKPSALFLIGMFAILLLTLMYSLYILDTGSLSDMRTENIFSHTEVCLSQNKTFNFNEVHFVIFFSFMDHVFGVSPIRRKKLHRNLNIGNLQSV